jgi:hypothetical protein
VVRHPEVMAKLEAELDAAGLYDTFEVDRVVAVELNPKAKQSDLYGALEPVVNRLLGRYKTAAQARKAALATGDEQGAKSAKDDMDVLVQAKGDMGAYQRLYSFLSQMLDYGNTDIEKRAIFYKRLIPLLEFGRERDTIDLSKVVLTHHFIKDKGNQALPLGVGAGQTIAPLQETGSGSVQEKQKALLSEIIAKLGLAGVAELALHPGGEGVVALRLRVVKAHPARTHDVVQRVHHLIQGGQRIVAVDLIEIDMIHVQALEACINRVKQMLAGEARDIARLLPAGGFCLGVRAGVRGQEV